MQNKKMKAAGNPLRLVGDDDRPHVELVLHYCLCAATHDVDSNYTVCII